MSTDMSTDLRTRVTYNAQDMGNEPKIKVTSKKEEVEE